MELAEASDEFLAEDGAQYGNRQQEEWMAGVDPALMIGRQSAGGNDAMDMIMGQQVGTPRVRDGEEPDLPPSRPGSRATSSRVWELASNNLDRMNSLREVRCQRVQFVRYGEDNVEVVGVEQVLLLCFEPSLASLCLAFRASSISRSYTRWVLRTDSPHTYLYVRQEQRCGSDSIARYAFNC